MRIEYDPELFCGSREKVAETITIKPGIHADFDQEGKIIGIGVIDAKEVLGHKIEFELPQLSIA